MAGVGEEEDGSTGLSLELDGLPLDSSGSEW